MHAQDLKRQGCEDYEFEFETLLESDALVSLALHRNWSCAYSGEHAETLPLLIERQSGQAYSLRRLYLLSDSRGRLHQGLRQWIAGDLHDQDPEQDFDELLSQVNEQYLTEVPLLFLVKEGIRVVPLKDMNGLGEVVLPWERAQRYLNTLEAQRLGWRCCATSERGRPP